MPRGKVKFYDSEKGFGFVLDDETGESVYVHASTLPDDVPALRPGQKVDFDIADSRRGPQVLSLRLLEPAPSVVRARRPKPEDMAGMVEDLIRLLDDAGNGLRQGRYPDRGHSQKIATVLRGVADNFES
ncbi:cold shock domain-containing protein [Brachybacterium sp. JHP9]|uniref:Cold shock domain-containing protein n=1 Tax=Brachybacterium equifaecis TaxID=2910770 RepID=A0ABT0QXM2_9MICO|nr:cold shock domain-containing protein [Brachybacterium equifaecis]